MNIAELIAAVTERQQKSPLTGKQILSDLLQPRDAWSDFVLESTYYSWYYHLADVLRPQSFAETGVRYGYSQKAMIDGAKCRAPQVWGIDGEVDNESTVYVWEKYFVDHYAPTGGKLRIDRMDTRKTQWWTGGPCDIGHVDACHTHDGCYHECELVRSIVRPGGIILVDDCNPGCVRDGAERFCRDRGLEFAFLPTLRGMIVIQN